VYCKNARINRPERLANLLIELQALQWDVICFDETRALKADVILDGGHRLISGTNEAKHLGTAVLLHASLADNVSKIQSPSDRLMCIDLEVGGLSFCIIAAYAPHSGYGQLALDQFYVDLHTLVRSAKQKGKRIVVAGDFNTQLNIGKRSEDLFAFASEHDLYVANNTEAPWGKTWTFESSTGLRRQLDYILLDFNLDVRRAEATNDLDLGSDHRAVFAHIPLPVTQPDISRPQKRQKVVWQGSPDYDAVAQEILMHSNVQTFSDLHRCVQQAAETNQAVSSKTRSPRPWDTAELRTLRDERRRTSDLKDRRQISKKIHAEMKKILRQCQTQRLRDKLESFKDLKELERICADPVKRKSVIRPSSDDFAACLQQVYASDCGGMDALDILNNTAHPVQPFSLLELQAALKKLSKKR